MFGVRGELKCRPAGDTALFDVGRSYDVVVEGVPRTLACTTVRRHHDKLLLGFAGIDTPEAARAYDRCELHVPDAAVELADDEYLDKDLVGLALCDERGTPLGRVVVGVEHYPAQDCLVLDPGRKLVPLVKAFVVRIDLGTKTIAMRLPEGIFD